MPCNRLITFAFACGLLAGAQTLHAQQRGTGTTGIPYVSGGIGQSEQGLLFEERLRYTLWLSTAAKGSGAYLSGVEVRIIDLGSRQLVLDHTLAGPWLMASLPAGRYEIELQYRASPGAVVQSRRERLTIGRKGLHHRVVYFNADDQVDSKREPSFESRAGSPHTKPLRSQDR